MPQLIAFRVIQGLGAGALFPVGMTIAADLFTLPATHQGLHVQCHVGRCLPRGPAGRKEIPDRTDFLALGFLHQSSIRPHGRTSGLARLQ